MTVSERSAVDFEAHTVFDTSKLTRSEQTIVFTETLLLQVSVSWLHLSITQGFHGDSISLMTRSAPLTPSRPIDTLPLLMTRHPDRLIT